ncbi:hypothetical protein NEFER03_1703 [Nematocida sp. LUAm3]|nr:hypothetical protein NEFER03_1703 [Nematocida sp. LUAm3]KAI5175693.1 hypothetical protein NEFER02_1580 [Nematocida sp. LUAm2]KAI5178599.1 hypothetical protein NEFER01_1735 [Nematocida sp. LUAm1]
MDSNIFYEFWKAFCYLGDTILLSELQWNTFRNGRYHALDISCFSCFFSGELHLYLLCPLLRYKLVSLENINTYIYLICSILFYYVLAPYSFIYAVTHLCTYLWYLSTYQVFKHKIFFYLSGLYSILVVSYYAWICYIGANGLLSIATGEHILVIFRSSSSTALKEKMQIFDALLSIFYLLFGVSIYFYFPFLSSTILFLCSVGFYLFFLGRASILFLYAYQNQKWFMSFLRTYILCLFAPLLLLHTLSIYMQPNQYTIDISVV